MELTLVEVEEEEGRERKAEVEPALDLAGEGEEGRAFLEKDGRFCCCCCFLGDSRCFPLSFLALARLSPDPLPSSADL